MKIEFTLEYWQIINLVVVFLLCIALFRFKRWHAVEIPLKIYFKRFCNFIKMKTISLKNKLKQLPSMIKLHKFWTAFSLFWILIIIISILYEKGVIR